MNPSVHDVLKALQFGDPQVSRNLVIVPLLVAEARGPEYLTLSESLEQNWISIKEVSQGGSVPDLRVINKAEKPVLLLDGEELVGAKQNRVVNTTILLKEKSETIIPVSCTEQGRWSHVSPEFADSGVVMAHKARAAKSRSIAYSLKAEMGFRSDQSEVWDEVEELQSRAGVRSHTGAMRDVFAQRERDLNQRIQSFPCQEGQCGLLAIFRGRVVGSDRVSRPVAYGRLHDKLLRSYAMEAILDKEKPIEVDARKLAHKFIKAALELKESTFPSVGYGVDFRYENGALCGSALVHEDTCIHMAFFSDTQENPQEQRPTGHMSGLRHRRAFRQRGPETV